MKQTLLLALSCHFLLASYAQPPTFSWVKTITFPNSSATAEVFDFCADSAGNSYVYGFFINSLNFGNGIFLQAQNAEEGYFVARYAPDGTLSWARKIVAPNGDFIFSGVNPGGISADNAGNVYISGQLSNPALDFGGGLVLQRSCTGTTCSDLFVTKYNATGDVQWIRQAAGSMGTFQTATRLVTGTDGTLFVAGNYEGQTLAFDNMLTYNSLNTNGMYLARYTPAGTALGAIFFSNGSGLSQVEHLAVTRQNAVLATGSYYAENLEFGNGISLEAFGDDGAANYFIVQYTAQGEAQWAYNLHSDSYLELLDVAADTAGQPYVVVDFTVNLLGGTELIAVTPVAGDSTGILLHLADNVFTPVVAVQYSGPVYPLANVTVDRNNRFFASGYFSNPPLAVDSVVIASKGCDDALLLSGHTNVLPLNWVRAAGGAGCEAILSAYFGRALATDQAGFLYTVGSFGGSLKLDGFIKTGDGLFVGKLATGTVGLDDPADTGLGFGISPNPSRGDFQITVDDPDAPAQMMVYDTQGAIRHQRFVRQADDLNFQLALPNGLYTVVLVQRNRLGRQKVLIINAP